MIYDAVQNMTALDLVSNPEQGKLLERIMEQLQEAVPQVIDRGGSGRGPRCHGRVA